MLARISDFIVGTDRRGRWMAVAANGRAGGFFVSRSAALRYARLETARKPGAVRLALAPLRLALDNSRLGHKGPSGWPRRGSAAPRAGSASWGGPAAVDAKWLMLDVGIAAGFVALCLIAASLVS